MSAGVANVPAITPVVKITSIENRNVLGVDATARAQQLALLRYESGEDSLSPLLDADRELIDVEFERAEARAVAQTADASLPSSHY